MTTIQNIEASARTAFKKAFGEISAWPKPCYYYTFQALWNLAFLMGFNYKNRDDKSNK